MAEAVSTGAEPAPAALPAKKRGPPLVLLGGLALLLIAGLIWGIPYYRYVMVHESTDDAFIEGPVVAVSSRAAGHVTRVLIHDNQPVKEGELIAEIDVRPFELRLERARAELDAVQRRKKSAQANTELSRAVTRATLQQAQSDVELYAAGVETAEAALSVAKSQIERLSAAYVSAQSALDEAHAAAAAVEAEFKRAAADLKRYQHADNKAVSAIQLDAAEAAAQAAEARFTEARTKGATAEAHVAETVAARHSAEVAVLQSQAQIAEAKARLEEAKGRLAQANAGPLQVALAESQTDVSDAETVQAAAAVKQAELDLSYTKIHAPCDGRITHKSVEAGAYVQPGDPLLMVIPAEVWVVANFRETQLASMRPGELVEIHVDAYPSRTFKGHVDSIQSGTGTRFSLLPPENATGNYVKVVQRVPVKILFDEKPDDGIVLAPGMSVIPEVLIK